MVESARDSFLRVLNGVFDVVESLSSQVVQMIDGERERYLCTISGHCERTDSESE
jgi:hypothetical protein